MQSTMNERAEESAQTIDSLRQKVQSLGSECLDLKDRLVRAERYVSENDQFVRGSGAGED